MDLSVYAKSSSSSSGLVTSYDIRPGNGAGPYLQPGTHMGPVVSMVKCSVTILSSNEYCQCLSDN